LPIHPHEAGPQMTWGTSFGGANRAQSCTDRLEEAR
jgi:hypothetical protein